MDTYNRVRVTEPGPFFGATGTVDVVYYDRLHTGNSYDELWVRLDDGRYIRVPSTKVEIQP